MDWPTQRSADTFAPIAGREPTRLDIYLEDSHVVDVRLDGESVYPTWFKVEWKENGELSAKVKGIRLATRLGDVIAFHQGPRSRPDQGSKSRTGT